MPLAEAQDPVAVGGMRLLGIVVGTVLLYAAMRAMFGKRRK